MNNREIDDWKKTIDEMSHEELAALHRFAPAGHPVFNINFPISGYFEDRFKELGGMTPEVSRKIGYLKPKNLKGLS